MKYEIKYKDSQGNEVTSDDGYVDVDAIPAGTSRSFSFYTTYVGNAPKASIKLTFDNLLILDFVAAKEWTGHECTAYFNDHPEELADLDGK